MENKEYFDNKEYVNFSSLKNYRINPAYYKYMLTVESKPTPEMILGSAYHYLILEPEKFDKHFLMLDIKDAPEPTKDYRTKANKEWRDNILSANQDKDIILIDDMNKIIDMKNVLLTDEYIKGLLTGGQSETPVMTELNGVKVKCKPDYKRKDYIIDLKTTTSGNSTPENFKKTIANYLYHVQAAMYLDACKEDDFFERKFIIIAQEKEAPYQFSKFLLSDNMISIGRYLYTELLSLHKYCTEQNEWKGNDIYANTDNGMIIIDLPKWASSDTNFIV